MRHWLPEQAVIVYRLSTEHCISYSLQRATSNSLLTHPLRVCMLIQHCGAGSAAAPQEGLDDVAWFVQISDTHLSAFEALPERFSLYGDKASDLRCCSTACSTRQHLRSLAALP